MSYSKTLGWLAVILFIPHGLVILGFSFVEFLTKINLMSKDEVMIDSISSIFVFPISLLFLHVASKHKNFIQNMHNWGLQRIKLKPSITFILVMTGFFMSFELIGIYYEMPMEPYMFQVQEAMMDPTSLVFIIISIVILAPIIEELIFRGWLYERLINAQYGAYLAIIIPSLLFTILHFQYHYGFTYISILIGSLLFGFIRYRTGNIYYCIISHSVMNALALIVLGISMP